MNESNPCIGCYNHESDIALLRSNNAELATTVQELKQKLASLEDRNKYLQEQYFTIHSKLVSTAIIPTVVASVRKCIPKLLEVSDEMTKIAHLCQIGSSVNEIKGPPASTQRVEGENKNPFSIETLLPTITHHYPIKIYDLYPGVRTFAVTPHTVNGHVLTNPVINIPRLSNGGLGSPKSRSTVKPNVCGSPSSPVLAGPSRSSGRQEENLYMRLASPPVSFSFIEEPQDEISYDEPEEDHNSFNETRSEENRRLSVISEENLSAVNRSPDNSQIRIYIDRVNVDQFTHSKRNSQRSTPWNSPDHRNSQSSSAHTIENDNLDHNESNSAILVPDDSTSTRNSLGDQSMYPPRNCFREFFETLSLTPSSEQPRHSTPFKNSSDKFPPHFSNFVTSRRKCKSAPSTSIKSLKVVLERVDLEVLSRIKKSPKNEVEGGILGNHVSYVSDRKRQQAPKTEQGSSKKKQPKNSPPSKRIIVKREKLVRAARPATPLVEPSLIRKLRRQ